MLRQITLIISTLLLLQALALGAIWPEEFFGYQRASVEAIPQGEDGIWEELGLEDAERVRYELNGKSFSAEAFRYNDATAAYSVYLWQRPQGAASSTVTALAAEWDDGMFFAHGNYVFRFDGFKPDEEQVVGMLLIVPMLEQSPLPTFPEFIPAEDRVPGTSRFVIGPESLEEFEPGVPPSVAGFHFGVEAFIADYRTPAGNTRMSVYSYPTPHIARERLPEFRMIPGAIVKRTGPLLAVILNPPSPDEAEKLLSRVNYRATISWDEYAITPEPTLVEILVTSFLLIGGLFLVAILFGAMFGGMRILRLNRNPEAARDDAMIALHIDDK